MKTTTRSLLPLLIVPVCMNATKAQDWTVGEPVDLLLYSQTFYGNCNPSPDYTFTFPVSTVTGVDYKVLIVAMDPPDGVASISPGLENGGLDDGLVLDAAVQRTVTFGTGTSSAVFEFRAQGTPLVAGESHPCSASPFWISNLMLCPEGLIPNVNAGCTVQAGATAVNEVPAQPLFQWPSPMNGQQLSVALSDAGTVRLTVLDATGRSVMSQSTGSTGSMDLSILPEGVYVLDAVRSNGRVMTRRFLIARQ